MKDRFSLCLCWIILVCNSVKISDTRAEERHKRVVATLSKHVESLNNIQTLSGKVTIEQIENIGQEVLESKWKKVEFVFDRHQRKALWNVQVAPEFVQQKNEVTKSKVVSSMTKYLQFFQLIHFPDETGYSPNSVTVSSLHHWTFDPKQDEFDVLFYLTAGTDSIQKAFLETTGLTQIDSLFQKAWKQETNGNRVTLIHQDQEHSLQLEYVIDQHDTPQLSRYSRDSPLASEVWEYSYQLVEGVYLPRQTSVKWIDKTTQHTLMQKLKWQSLSVNQSLPEDRFTLTHLGAKSGDIVEDKSTGLKFVATKQVHEENDQTTAIDASVKSETPLIWYVILNVLVWLLLFIVVSLVWKRSPHRNPDT